MALRDLEGWEAQSGLVWDLQSQGSVSTTVLRGYWSRGSWNLGGGASRRSIPGTASGDLYFGIGIYFSSTGARFILRDSGAAILNILEVGAAGKLKLWGDNLTTLLATGNKTLAINTWYFIEWHSVISDTVGVGLIKVDEVTDIDVSGADTKPGSTTTISMWEMSGNVWVDDFYCDDAAFLGDCGVKGLFPSAAGDVTQLTRGGSDSGANWSQADEAPPNNDTDYVYHSTVNNYDLYNIENLDSELSGVKGLKLQAFAKKNDAGAASLALGVKYDSDGNGTADTESWGSDQALSTSYAVYERLMEQDPIPSGWTQSEVNALQVGVKVR